MCGIVGYCGYKNKIDIQRNVFEWLVESLFHRGPDDRGIYQADSIGLGHRRLSVLDISERGRQPMSSPDKKVWLIYNGEIYNFKQIRKRLADKGYKMISRSDTEVILYSYIEWGLECINMFNGMFAFAIWDSRYNRLWLARDQIGIKPLYYSDYKGIIYFASEISTLLDIPDIPKDPDPFGIDSYFTFGYIPAPMTGYKFIKQLLPGQYLLIENSNIKSVKYWDFPLSSEKIRLSEKECIEEFDNIFTKVVKRQMVSDVPLGALLSGGTDSFAVVRAMRKNSDGELKVFCGGFEDDRFDELENAKLAAKTLGVKLVTKRFRRDFNHILDSIAPHCQDPFADSSCLPMYMICELASKHVKVVLSGDGADELLGGYDVYKISKMAHMYRKIPHFIRKGILRPMARRLPETGGKYSLREKATRFVYGAEHGKWRDHTSWRTIISKQLKKQMYTPEFWNEVRNYDPLSYYEKYIKEAKEHGCFDLDCYLYADLKFYLPNDMLVKVDRMSMAHSLEVRVPFLDLEMVNFCWRLPVKLKIMRGRLKYILRKVINDLYPHSLQKMPKSGFNMAPYTNFIPGEYYDNAFYRSANLDMRDQFGDYGSFLIAYSKFILNYALKKHENSSLS